MPPLNTIGMKISHVYSFLSLKFLLETTYPIDVSSAIAMSVPTIVTRIDMNAARRIMPRSFHRNLYAEPENTEGISWYPFVRSASSSVMEIENTNNSGITHITANTKNMILNTMFVDFLIWFKD